MRRLAQAMLVLVLLGLAVVAYGYWIAASDPVVRRTSVELGDWPAEAPPIRVLLVSDIHVTGPEMPPARLDRIVGQINALAPDIVMIAGDFIGDRTTSTRTYPSADAIKPLAGLRARAFAVLGNHDHWRSAPPIRAALERARVTVLDNEAVAVGPLSLGGVDDDHIGRADLPRTVAAMRALPGAKVLLSHSPDPFAALPADVGLMLAGHTHCGQLDFPVIGRLATASKHGERYACGRIEEAGRTLVVGAGVGTSVLPLRIGAAPDMWLIEIGSRRGA